MPVIQKKYLFLFEIQINLIIFVSKLQNMKYDYLIVGAGLYGSMFAYSAESRGKKCLVVEKNNHVGGLCYTKEKNGILVHVNGAHIFHTDSKTVWEFVNSIVPFIPYVNSPLANYKGEIYNLPFNMNTFSKVFGVTTPAEAKSAIEEDIIPCANPVNLEEHCLSLIGVELYERFVKGYTEKQWGKKCTELSSSLIKRIPLRFTYDNNYFNDTYQGIPINGYTHFIENLIKKADVKTNVDYLCDLVSLNKLADKVVYTGAIDTLFDYRLGKLDYRSVRFEHEYMYDVDNFQGNAVVNYTDFKVPYTRIIEHKHFAPYRPVKGTFISREYPADPKDGYPPYYPVNDSKNNALYNEYRKLAEKKYPNMIFGGRLGEYRYYNMNDIIEKFIYGKENRGL